MLLFVEFHDGVKEVYIHFESDVDGEFLDQNGCFMTFDDLFAFEWELEEDYNLTFTHEIGDRVDGEFLSYLKGRN